MSCSSCGLYSTGSTMDVVSSSVSWRSLTFNRQHLSISLNTADLLISASSLRAISIRFCERDRRRRRVFLSVTFVEDGLLRVLDLPLLVRPVGRSVGLSGLAFRVAWCLGWGGYSVDESGAVELFRDAPKMRDPFRDLPGSYFEIPPSSC
jgi:hypothetical protein